MASSRHALVVSLGVSLSAFLLVGVAVTELASSAIEFSVFLGIPAGLVAAAVAGAMTYHRLRSRSSERTIDRGVAEAVAGFGYALVLLTALRYAVPPVRPLLGFGLVVATSVVVSLALGTRSLLGHSRYR